MGWQQKKITLRDKREKIKKIMVSTSFRIALFCFILLFGFLYIVETNSASTKGYTMYEMENKIDELSRENRNLAVEIAKYQSMQSIQERLKETDLVLVGEVDYITDFGKAVAQR